MRNRILPLALLLFLFLATQSCSDTPTMSFGDYDTAPQTDGDAVDNDIADNAMEEDADTADNTMEAEVENTDTEEPENDDDVQEADPEEDSEENMPAAWHFDTPWVVNRTTSWGDDTACEYNALHIMPAGETPMVFFSPNNSDESNFAFNYFLPDEAAEKDFRYTSSPGITGEGYSLTFSPYSYRLNRAMTDRTFFMMGEYVENYPGEVVQHRESIAVLPVSMGSSESIQTPDITLTQTCAQIYSFEWDSHFACWSVKDMQLISISQTQSAFLFYLKEAMDSGDEECGSDLNAAGCYYSHIDEQNVSFPAFLYRNGQPGPCPDSSLWGNNRLHSLYLDGDVFTTNRVQVWYTAIDPETNTATQESEIFSTALGSEMPSHRLLTDTVHERLYFFAYERNRSTVEAIFLYSDMDTAATQPWHTATGKYEAFISGSSAFYPPAFVITPQGDVLAFVLKRRGEYDSPNKESFIEMWLFSPQTGDFSFIQTVLDHIPGFPDRDSPSTSVWPERKIEALYVNGNIYLTFIASGEYTGQLLNTPELGGYHIIGTIGTPPQE